MMANMADGGKTPIRTVSELAAIGYKLAIFPPPRDWLRPAPPKCPDGPEGEGHLEIAEFAAFPFAEFNTLIGFEDVWAFERRWARPTAEPG